MNCERILPFNLRYSRQPYRGFQCSNLPELRSETHSLKVSLTTFKHFHCFRRRLYNDTNRGHLVSTLFIHIKQVDFRVTRPRNSLNLL